MVKEIKKGLEKSGKLKISGCTADSGEYIYSVQGKREIVQEHLPSYWGLSLKGGICSLVSKFFSLRVIPNFHDYS